MCHFSVSVIVPVYNEEEYIPKTFSEIFRVLNGHFIDFEIIFVDDGSKDRSFSIMRDLCQKHSFVRILHNSVNKGLGEALRSGFSVAKKEVILYIDCDLPFEPSFLIRAAPFLASHDIIIGKRNQWDGRSRFILSRIYHWLIFCLFGLGCSDINVGVKVFRNQALKNLDLRAKGSFIDAEFLLEAVKKGLKIKELPCFYSKRMYGHSKLNNAANIIEIIVDMFKYFLRDRIDGRRKN